MPWPSDHPASTDPLLMPWAGGLEEVVPGAQVHGVLRYLPGRRVATMVELAGKPAVVKVFASPRARGNSRRLRAFAASGAADVVPTVLGCDDAGHVLAISYRHGVLPTDLSDSQYEECFHPVGAALRRIHDSGTKLDRSWDWEKEVAQLRRATPPAAGLLDLVETVVASTRWLAGAPLSPAHRDAHPRQVVVAVDGSVAFIDLDDAAMAPRGLDIGNMLGHLVLEKITGKRSERVTRRASDAFLAGYGGSAELDDGVLTGWTVLAVARLAGLAESRHGDPTQRDALHAYCRSILDRVWV